MIDNCIIYENLKTLPVFCVYINIKVKALLKNFSEDSN